MTNENIVIFSSGPVGALFLEEVLRYKNIKVSLVVICNNKNNPFFLDDKVDPVETICLFNNINIEYNPDSVIGSKFNLALSFGNFHILKQEHIDTFKYGIINFHGAPIQLYKGSAAPAYHILHEDKPSWGYTYHYIEKDLDSGDIIEQNIYKIPEGLSSEEINNTVIKTALHNLHSFLDYLIKSQFKPKTTKNNITCPIKRKDLENLAVLNKNLSETVDFDKKMRAFDWPKVIKHPKVIVNNKEYRLVPEKKYNDMLKIYRKIM